MRIKSSSSCPTTLPAAARWWSPQYYYSAAATSVRHHHHQQQQQVVYSDRFVPSRDASANGSNHSFDEDQIACVRVRLWRSFRTRQHPRKRGRRRGRGRPRTPPPPTQCARSSRTRNEDTSAAYHELLKRMQLPTGGGEETAVNLTETTHASGGPTESSGHAAARLYDGSR